MKKNFHEITVVTVCPFCGKAHEVEVNEMDYLDWKDGALVQEAFPYLSAEDREMLISGICPDCWNGMFSVEEDEYTDDYDDFDLEMGFDPYEGCWTGDC